MKYWISDMLEELFQLTRTFEFEEDGGVCVVGARWLNDKNDLEMLLDVSTGNDDNRQKWKILCNAERENRIAFGWSHYFEIHEEHCLLWLYNHLQFSLWFSGRRGSSSEVIGELWQAHQKYAGHYFPFSRFINSADSLDSLIADGHGKLAEGPQNLMDLYESVLRKHGFKTSKTLQRSSLINQSNEVNTHRLKVLVIGDTYVVAERFEAEHVS